MNTRNRLKWLYAIFIATYSAISLYLLYMTIIKYRPNPFSPYIWKWEIFCGVGILFCVLLLELLLISTKRKNVRSVSIFLSFFVVCFLSLRLLFGSMTPFLIWLVFYTPIITGLDLVLNVEKPVKELTAEISKSGENAPHRLKLLADIELSSLSFTVIIATILGVTLSIGALKLYTDVAMKFFSGEQLQHAIGGIVSHFAFMLGYAIFGATVICLAYEHRIYLIKMHLLEN